ncbi:hypothetical protein EOPP23_14210 [Endozoicomonas sp. OPT23]|uniref:DNA-binding protein n=1 Tax=Endozoicomonas sp. OPT23 TaxID=2072845 RepID=UPI00129AA7B7|nr:DNA-binding protein [Endozoicomonas sp. OPT23]MRI34143.1 hypothetical protein [Endozoicomonas sp. OPT23]
MNTSDKEIQRRELVFRVLDDMKANGERINADKVARLAKMGKQTVLPHYNEWRFLDDAEKEVDEELPADLVRVLKRALLEWRHTATESQRQFEEDANQEIDQLQATLDQMTTDQIQLKQSLEELKNEREQFIKEKTALQQQTEELRRKLAVEESSHQSQQTANEQLQEQLKTLKSEQTHALTAQEKKLDNQYQGQINHWIKMVDNERRLRSDLEAQLKEEKSSALAMEKERNDLHIRLENKSKAYLDACEERNQFKQQLKPLAQLNTYVTELSLLLNQPAEKVTLTVRELIRQEQDKDKELAFVPALKEKSRQLEKDLENYRGKADSMVKLEIELEKQKGYREALEMALEKASRPMEKS